MILNSKKQYQEDNKRFSELLSSFTGINKSYLNEYLEKNSAQTIFEHPATLDLTEKQFQKLNSLAQLKSIYSNLKDGQEKYIMNSPDNVRNYFNDYYPELKDKEYVACSFLDTKLQVIRTEIIHEGTVNSSLLSPREVAKKALMYDSSSVALAHNHPSGNPKPSSADIEVTRKVKNALETLDISLIDHVIIGDNDRTTSLKMENLMEEKSHYREHSKMERVNQMKQRLNQRER